MQKREEILNPVDVEIYGERVAWELHKENLRSHLTRFVIANRANRADLSRLL